MIYNNDCLAAEEKVKIPDTSYKNAKSYLAINKSNIDENVAKMETEQKQLDE